jgi:hypothetical protein
MNHIRLRQAYGATRKNAQAFLLAIHAVAKYRPDFDPVWEHGTSGVAARQRGDRN